MYIALWSFAIPSFENTFSSSWNAPSFFTEYSVYSYLALSIHSQLLVFSSITAKAGKLKTAFPQTPLQLGFWMHVSCLPCPALTLDALLGDLEGGGETGTLLLWLSQWQANSWRCDYFCISIPYPRDDTAENWTSRRLGQVIYFLCVISQVTVNKKMFYHFYKAVVKINLSRVSLRSWNNLCDHKLLLLPCKCSILNQNFF